MNRTLLWLLPPLLFALMILMSLNACVHDPWIVEPDPSDTIPSDTLPPADTTSWHGCSPDTVYFAREILPLLISNCAISGCHDAVTHEEGINLTTYEKVIQTGMVKPGKPIESKLYKSITETDPGDIMPPPPAPPLSAQQIALVRKWIEQGAKNLACEDGPVCDTAAVSYIQVVLPILQRECVGCHTGNNPGGGIKLNTHEAVQVVALNGQLYGSINHAAGFAAMPPSGNKIPDCEIRKIKAWIDTGALNN